MNAKVSLSDILSCSTPKGQLDKKVADCSVLREKEKQNSQVNFISTVSSTYVEGKKSSNLNRTPVPNLNSMFKKVKILDQLMVITERIEDHKKRNTEMDRSSERLKGRSDKEQEENDLGLSDTTSPLMSHLPNYTELESDVEMELISTDNLENLMPVSLEINHEEGGYKEKIPDDNSCDEETGNKENILDDNALAVKNKEEIKCKVCHKKFKQKSTFTRHKLLQNCKIPTTICSFCQKDLKNAKALDMHILRNHRRPVFKCINCPKVFPTESRMVNHFNHHHTSKSCENCKKVFKNSNTLRSHRHKCLGNKKKIRSSEAVTKSKKTKYSRNCPECDATFKSRGGFNKHMNKFHKFQEPAVESQIENECVVEFVNNLVMGEEIEIVTVDI